MRNGTGIKAGAPLGEGEMTSAVNEISKCKERYFKSKKDVRFLHHAMIRILNENRDTYKQAEIEWIFRAMEKEFRRKLKTNEKNERIGALVAHIVSNGGDVLTTLEAVEEWLRISKTTIRDAYYKLVKVFGIDPKTDNPMEDWEFRVFYGRIPVEYYREYTEKGRAFPETPDYERVNKALEQATEKSFQFEQEGIETETQLFRLMFGDEWVDEKLQKKSA